MNRGLFSSFFATLFAVSTLAAAQQDTVEKSFSTTGAGRLSLHLPNGPITIDTHHGSEVSIAITRSLRAGGTSEFKNELEKVDMTFEQSGNTIDCRVKYDRKNKGWSRFFGNRKHIQFKTVVSLPQAFNVEARTAGGSVSVQNLKGSTDLITSGGSISLSNVFGDSKARTSGGGITANHCGGDFEMRTSGGSIKVGQIDGNVMGKTSGGNIVIGDIEGNAVVSTSGGSITLGTVLGNLEAHTSGGGIKATLAGQPSEKCELKTSGGSIRIQVNPSVKLDIDASTSGGGVHCNLTLSNLQLKRSSLVGQLNGGGPKLIARTSGGGIHIQSI